MKRTWFEPTFVMPKEQFFAQHQHVCGDLNRLDESGLFAGRFL